MTPDTPRKRRRWPYAVGAAALALALTATPAVGAVTDVLRSPDGSTFSLTVDNDGKLGTKRESGPTPVPTTPAPTTTTPAATVDLKVDVVSASTLSVAWNPLLAQAVYGRDGTDATGYGTWKSDPGATPPSRLTALRPATEYTVTVSGVLGGKAVTQSTKVTTAAVSTPAPTTTTPAPSPTTSTPPPVSTEQFHPTTLGAAVTGAANGDFNRWANFRHGMYGTWAADGKAWAIDTPTSEYGANSVARLGQYDLDLAAQRKNVAGWAGAATGRDDANWRKDLGELKAKWGTRAGHVYYRPWHEFNGSWYAWSVKPADAENFKKAWARFHGIFVETFGNDPRFHLVWSPNRDSHNNVDVRQFYPGSQYVDAIGVDYYDFSRADTEAEWAQELNRTQNGGSPVGLAQWDALATEKGVPWYMPEYGVQFGDNAFFAGKVLEFCKANRHDGAGSAAGDCLGGIWHNLQGSSPDPSAGGDFFVQSGGRDYAKRPATAKVVRDFIATNKGLLYQAG